VKHFFFEKINKIDKLLAKPIKTKREKTTVLILGRKMGMGTTLLIPLKPNDH
jgi:hypothetical protein